MSARTGTRDLVGLPAQRRPDEPGGPARWRPSWAVLGYGPNPLGALRCTGDLALPEMCAGSVWRSTTLGPAHEPCPHLAGHLGSCAP